MNDTIFALSSGAGMAGVAVLRLSGPGAGEVVTRLLGGARIKPRFASLRALRDPADGALIDRGLVLWFPGPASYTGEDMAEFHVHGGRAVVARLHGALAAMAGMRLALPGEFTRRAFDNGKLDLTEVEGIADLIAAQTEAQRRQAARIMDGEAGRLVEQWRAVLTRALAMSEADLDFSDEEDVPASDHGALVAAIGAVHEAAERELARGNQGERVREGLRVVIAGPPNAGKSSLLNALSRRDAAIVSERAGTTRDVIEVHMDLAGYPVTLVDTAGLRDSGDEIEREGIERARRAMARADLVLWLEAGDMDERLATPDVETLRGAPVQRILSKADLAGDTRGDGDLIAVSATTGAGLETLAAWLGAKAGDLCAGGESALITRARHREALVACHEALGRYLRAHSGAPELRAEELRLAVRALGRITGRVDVEDILDIIFADFCIGK